jgi:Domain of unknown function (DU1801)
MTSKTLTIDAYLAEIPSNRKQSFIKLRETILNNLPFGFEEVMIYGMIGYVVPHSIYPNGYHCDPKLPLTFVNIANQKNFIAIYHVGLYMNHELSEWFVAEYPKYSKSKLDMGKSCIRFKKPEEIPFQLIGELMKKMTVDSYLKIYESNLKSK